ncbi:MAG: ABC transporter ATP-binding protein [Clostridia bacterium]|nr:ABC transporter ATP-binding protein [Clostridia bacterium]
MIEVKGLIKTFDDFRALDGVDLHAPRGGVYGLVGANGAGKTTLIRHLTGVYRQDAGSITIDGQQVYENNEIKQRIAYIPDDVFYFLTASTQDMKAFYKSIYPRFDEERFKRLREAFSVDEKRPVRLLSRGMQKQSAFWLAMCMHPDVMILDEPVDGLDPVMRRQIWSLLMQDVTERGMTVLVSSHNLRELEDVCDHVGVINNGRMMLQRSLSSLQDNIVKLQIVVPGELDTTGMEVMHHTTTGRIHTLIVRGNADEVSIIASKKDPVFFDILPISLEEIFIYELGGVDYAVKEIVL